MAVGILTAEERDLKSWPVLEETHLLSLSTLPVSPSRRWCGTPAAAGLVRAAKVGPS